MPIYEYKCRECDTAFEVLVNTTVEPECPECRSPRLDKQFSTFAPKSGAPIPEPNNAPICQTCGVPEGPCALN